MLRRGLLLTAISMGALFQVQAQQINFERGDWQTVWNKAVEQKKMLFAELEPVPNVRKLTDQERRAMEAASYYPSGRAAELYNKFLLNWRSDVDTTRDYPAKRYLVSGLPAAFIVDAAENRVLYRFDGLPSSEAQMLQAYSEAEEERKDKMTLAQYQNPLDAGNLSTPLLLKYLQKRKRLQLDNSQALHLYLIQVDPDIRKVSDSALRVAERYETSFDGTGSKYYTANIRQVYGSVHKGDSAAVQAVLLKWARQTLKKAIAERNEGVLEATFERLGSTDPVLLNEYANKLGMEFYKTLGNTSMYLSYLKKDAERICQIPDTLMEKRSAAFREAATQKLRKEAAATKIDPDYYLQQHLNDLDTGSVSYKQAAYLKGYANAVNEQFSHDEYTMNDAIRWIEKAIVWRENKGGDVVEMYFIYAKLLYKNHRESEAQVMYARFLERNNQFAYPDEGTLHQWQKEWAELTAKKQR